MTFFVVGENIVIVIVVILSENRSKMYRAICQKLSELTFINIFDLTIIHILLFVTYYIYSRIICDRQRCLPKKVDNITLYLGLFFTFVQLTKYISKETFSRQKLHKYVSFTYYVPSQNLIKYALNQIWRLNKVYGNG